MQMADMKREAGLVDTIQEHISVLETELPKITDVVIKTQKEETLLYLKKKRDDLMSKKSMYDYFFYTVEILFNYY